MRRSFDGLARAVVESLGEDPRTRHSLFVFVNHKRDRLKILWGDTTGWCLLSKRLDENVVALPTHIPDGATSISVDAAALARFRAVSPISVVSHRRAIAPAQRILRRFALVTMVEPASGEELRRLRGVPNGKRARWSTHGIETDTRNDHRNDNGRPRAPVVVITGR
jgi:transposase